MGKVRYYIGAFLVPQFVEHIVPDEEQNDRTSDGNGKANATPGYPSVKSNARKSCGQSQRSARDRRKARQKKNKAC